MQRGTLVGPMGTLALFAHLTGGAAWAQLHNGTFDQDVAGWSHAAALEIVWDARDAANRPASGSLRMRNLGTTDNGAFPSASQCVAVQGGAATTLSAQVLVPPGQAVPVEVLMQLFFDRGVACDGGTVSSTSAPTLTTTNGLWEQTSLQIVAPSTARSATVFLGLRKPGGGAAVAEALWDDVVLRVADGSCRPEFEALCLNGDQFRATVRWRDSSDRQGVGQALPLTGDSGLFWFFSGNNLELLVKVIDGCAINERYWVFAAATTDVEYDLVVEHLATGTTRAYRNTLGVAADAITDTDAFFTCAGAQP